MTVTILKGDCRHLLRTLPDESVHCVVTSPPYWGLRDYGVAGQIGLEPEFQSFIQTMVSVFREVRRVLRKDGTCWVNIGDSYAGGGRGGGDPTIGERNLGNSKYPKSIISDGLKPKDLCGIPWRVAFALQADGWWLRQDIIWAKPNPMPESVTDRCTKAHEYIFLLSKSARYFYDAEAIKELSDPDQLAHNLRYAKEYEAHTANVARGSSQPGNVGSVGIHARARTDGKRNKRSVWEVATAPFSEAHFATFPPELIEPCIKAGCPDKCCPHCGKGWERIVERIPAIVKSPASDYGHGAGRNDGGRSQLVGAEAKTLGFQPTCSCPAHQPIGGTVLDPFGGAGTTGLVADRLQRDAILIELNPTYAAMAERRIQNDAPLFALVAAE